jgi:hypothetical protein
VAYPKTINTVHRLGTIEQELTLPEYSSEREHEAVFQDILWTATELLGGLCGDGSSCSIGPRMFCMDLPSFSVKCLACQRSDHLAASDVHSDVFCAIQYHE